MPVTLLVSIFASDILPIFLIAGVGFLLARWLDGGVKTLAHVVFYALVPCLVFKLLVASTMSGPQVGRMALLAVLVTGLMGLLALVVAMALRLSRAELSAFLLVVMFSNGGNYGLPVALFAFGTEALSHATVYFVASSMLTNTAALLVLASGISVPIAVMRPIGLLGDAALPMMVLVLGMQLERARVAERPTVVAVAVGLSLIVAPIVALGLSSFLGLSGAARQAGVILASMPVAVVTTILALEFDVAPAFVTNAVFISTLLSPLTLTPLIAYLRR
ncbi:MAG: hypothetical protein DMG12_22495 [Acidobacteria bacterium]|nr:MAG: hypothetical protein DMG12_22495 [Acidobacteriota bacterium]